MSRADAPLEPAGALQVDWQSQLPDVLVPLARGLERINRLIASVGTLALVVASVVLTYSVVSRQLFRAATDWEDEAAVFCLVGAVFMSGALVQSFRGHVGIDALATVLPAAVNRWRIAAVDLISGLFCGFFAWKSWTLFAEAWTDGQTTSSTWAPPLWIPYGLMALGMTLLTVQLLLQLSADVRLLSSAAVSGSAAGRQ